MVTVGGACNAAAAATFSEGAKYIHVNSLLSQWCKTTASRNSEVEWSFSGSESGWEKEKCKVTHGSKVSNFLFNWWARPVIKSTEKTDAPDGTI